MNHCGFKIRDDLTAVHIAVLTDKILERFMVFYGTRFPVKKGNWRVLSWYAGSRSFRRCYSPGAVKQVKRSGLILELDPTDFVDQSLYLSGMYEFADHSELMQAAKPGHVAVDIGAHIGAYTLALAGVLGRTGHVHAFEPNPGTFRRLTRNVELNNLQNVQLNQLAISDIEGEAELSSPIDQNTSAASLVRQERIHGLPTRTCRIRTTTLDRYAEAKGMDRLDLLKIDAQGYEMQVLHGAKDVIRRFRPRMMVEYDPYWLSRAGSSGQELCADLRDLGYSLFEVRRAELVPASPQGDELMNLHCLPA